MKLHIIILFTIILFVIADQDDKNKNLKKGSLPPYPIVIETSQTAYGRYKIWKPNIDIYSAYIMDDVKKLLRLDIGVKEDSLFNIYFFSQNGVTIVGWDSVNSKYTCTDIPSLTYEHQVNGYDDSRLVYIGTMKFTDKFRKGPEVHALWAQH